MLLTAEHLSINFGSRQLLSDMNFYLSEGDKVGIIGINGTGKSALLKVLAGVLEATLEAKTERWLYLTELKERIDAQSK